MKIVFMFYIKCTRNGYDNVIPITTGLLAQNTNIKTDLTVECQVLQSQISVFSGTEH